MGRVPGRGAGRGDRDRRARADPRARHDVGQPRAVHTEQRSTRGGARLARLHGQRRHLPERDDAARRRDPAADRRTCRARTTTCCSCSFAIRNVANYSPPVLEPEPDGLDEWEIMAKLALIAQGQGASADPDIADDVAISGLRLPRGRRRGRTRCRSRLRRDPRDARGRRRGPERLVDFMMRSGPYGDWFGERDRYVDPDGAEQPALSARFLERTPTASISARCSPACPTCCAHRRATSSWRRQRCWPTSIGCAASLDRDRDGEVVLVGRRDLRSNNSWMHNVNVLVKGKERCTLQVHPNDAQRSGSSTARSPGSRRVSASSMCRSRSPTRSGPASCRCPTGGVTTSTGVALSCRVGAAGRELQRPDRRGAARPRVGHGGAERHPGDGHCGVARRMSSSRAAGQTLVSSVKCIPSGRIHFPSISFGHGAPPWHTMLAKSISCT